MSLPARDWLPGNALADGVVRRLVSEHAKRWVTRWIADEREIVVGTQAIAQPTKIPNSRRLITNQDQTIALSADQASSLKLGAAIISAPAGAKPSAGDIGLYRALAERALGDLGEDMARLFACSAP